MTDMVSEKLDEWRDRSPGIVTENELNALINVCRAANTLISNYQMHYEVQGGLAITGKYETISKFDMFGALKDALKDLGEL